MGHIREIEDYQHDMRLLGSCVLLSTVFAEVLYMEKKATADKKILKDVSENDVLDNDHIGSVLTSLDEQLASLDENNVIENETVDKKDVFIKKPFVAESPEYREEMIKAEEWLQALAEP